MNNILKIPSSSQLFQGPKYLGGVQCPSPPVPHTTTSTLVLIGLDDNYHFFYPTQDSETESILKKPKKNMFDHDRDHVNIPSQQGVLFILTYK